MRSASSSVLSCRLCIAQTQPHPACQPITAFIRSFAGRVCIKRVLNKKERERKKMGNKMRRSFGVRRESASLGP